MKKKKKIKMRKRGSTLSPAEWENFKLGWAAERPDVVACVIEQSKKVPLTPAELFELTARAWFLSHYDCKLPTTLIRGKKID